MSPASAPAAPAQRETSRAPVARLPFTSAAHEHTEPAFQANAVALTAAQQNLGPYDVPAYGYLRHIFLEVVLAGGVLGAGALAADAPHSLFQSIQLLDTNGAPIYGPLGGYATLWANIIGGYAYNQDPRRSPWYVSTINATFFLRIPVEINHFDGLGCIQNQNAAGAYKVSLALAPQASYLSTAPTTYPTVTIKGWLEAWSQPNEVDVAGRPQSLQPPAHGTAQFWSSKVLAVVAGQNTLPITRVGNLIRNIVIIFRTAAGARSDTVCPDPLTLQWDARGQWQSESQNYRIQNMFEKLENLSARDAGVFWYAFAHSNQGRNGDGPPNLWLPTVQSTRMELQGVAAAAGTAEIMINDISVAEVNPAERYVETSATGFHPQVGIPNAYAQ